MKFTLAVALSIVLLINIVGLVVLYVAPPETGEGGVDLLMIVNPTCDNCFNASLYQPELAAIGVTFDDVKTVEYGTHAATRAIKKYDITKLPALVFSKELGQYDAVANAWSRVGTIAKDGNYILQGTNPPYYDLGTGKVRGLVSVTYLDKASCDDCYDPQLHRDVLTRYGMVFSNEQTIDVDSPEGQALIEQYGITKVPTILLKGDASLYPGFDAVWQSVGKRFEDGTYIFTNIDSIEQPYYDLENDSLVKTQ